MGHHSSRVLEWLFGAVLFFALLGRLVRLFSAGGGDARAARFRIEAELARYNERPRARPAPGPGWSNRDPDDAGSAHPPPGTIPEPPGVEERRRTLHRRLASVEEVLRQSSFEGERTAALAARERILGQLAVLT